MGKIKTRFICQECGTIAVKWLGKCPECSRWNTFVEEEVTQYTPANPVLDYIEPEELINIAAMSDFRMNTDIEEFDRVVGGGLVSGSILLIGGPPGIGKSTLLLQIAENISKKSGNVLYVTGEESNQQVKIRSNRLNIEQNKIFVLPEINFDIIAASIEKMKPVLVMIDSIQTLYKPDFAGAPGSVTQVRECTASLLRIGKSLGITVIIVGHVTKDGSIAGPRILEHLVDTVLYFEGDGFQNFRILKSVKNRFGSTNEVGIFEMHARGLISLKNPSKFFLTHRGNQIPGSVVVPIIEGSRSLLVELQALVTRSYYGVPARKSNGIDVNRLALIIAVLEKRASLQLSTSDVFVNIVGGVEINEPAFDLGLITAISSSYYDVPAYNDCVVFGEVGLGGEVRGVSHIPKRIQEAQRLGFKQCIIPFCDNDGITDDTESIEIFKVRNIKEAIDRVLIEKRRK